VGNKKKTLDYGVLEGWPYNMNFWTGGTQKGCQGQWGWCGAGGGIGDDIKWEKGQPDNKGGQENCVHMRFVLNATGTIITDRNCTNKYIYACEVEVA
jgi:Lectin C-type domain